MSFLKKEFPGCFARYKALKTSNPKTSNSKRYNPKTPNTETSNTKTSNTKTTNNKSSKRNSSIARNVFSQERVSWLFRSLQSFNNIKSKTLNSKSPNSEQHQNPKH